MDTILQGFSTYYGLDWMSMALGVYGWYLITNRNAAGFASNFCASLCSVVVAVMSGQYGFVVANLIFMGIAIRGYWAWSRLVGTPEIQAAE